MLNISSPSVSTQINWLATLLTLIVVITLPVGYFALAYQNLKGRLGSEVNSIASHISTFISTNPKTWRFHEYRLPTLIASLSIKDKDNAHQNAIRVHDKQGQLVVEDLPDTTLLTPIMTLTAHLHDFGETVGQIELQHSLRPLLRETTWVALLGLLLGLTIYFPLRILPQRALSRMLESLQLEREKLIESESRSMAITDTAAEAIIVLDNTGKVVYWNPAAEQIFGYSQEEAVGQLMHDLIVAEAHHEVYRKNYAIFSQTGTGGVIGTSTEMLALRKDGSEFPVSVSVSAVKLREQWHAVGVVRDISRRKQAEQALILARDEAERANTVKSEFLSRMSHELRTPLNAILGFGQLLELDKNSFNHTQQENIRDILDAGHHLLTLINEVLDLAKIESGNLELSIEKLKIDDLLQQSINLLRREASIRNVQVLDRISGNGYCVQADPTRLKQVLVNILSNAVKYNREGGLILLFAKVIDPYRLRISINDQGEGLTEHDMTRLFTPFERLDTANNTEGTGIGLVITKHLIQLMGGTIGVESTPGEGCTFWVELALSKDSLRDKTDEQQQ